MTTNYPNSLDTTAILGNSYTDATPTKDEHAQIHNNQADATLAIETELGILPKGSFASVAARLAALIYQSPTATQVIAPTGNFVPLIVKAHASQTARLLEIRANDDTVLGYIDKDGNVNAAGYRQSGAPLASTHLSDSSSILKNPSPSITTPTISNATMTGTPTAPTPATNDNSTTVATTAYVINQGYAKAASPAFTGNPTAPTAPVDTNTTQIATTAFTINQITNTPQPQPPTGLTVAYAGTTAPSGWLLCDGSAVSRSTYSDLFNVIGTTYGSGDGSTTFNLPDLRGRFAVGLGTHVDVDALNDNDGVAVGSRRPKHAHTFSLSGNSGGGHSHSVTINSVGGHTHNITGTSGSFGVISGPGSTVYASGSKSTSSAGSHSHSLGSIGTAGGGSHTVTGTIGQSGIDDTPAYIVLNYIIKT